MRFCRCAFSLAVRAWLVVFAGHAFAQIESGQWVGDSYMVWMNSDSGVPRWAFVDEADIVHRVIPNVVDSAGFPDLCHSCGGASWSYWHGDSLYTLADAKVANEDGTISRRHTLARWREGKWHFLASLMTGRRNLLNFVPCDDGHFIMVSNGADLYDDNRQGRSPFCRVSLQEGRDALKVDFSIDHGQEDLRKHMSATNCFELAWYSKIIITEGRATLVNRYTGLYWVFSTETASLVKASSIFRNVTPEMIAKGGFSQAVLCANPEKSGTVLVSAQDEDLFIAAKQDTYSEVKALYAMHPDGGRDAEIEALVRRKLEEARERSPRIVWYRIHSDTGRVERLKEPPEGGASVREGWKNDIWRPMPDGSVKMGWDPHYSDGLKEQVSKWAGDPKGEGVAKEAKVAVSGTSDSEPPQEGDGAAVVAPVLGVAALTPAP